MADRALVLSNASLNGLTKVLAFAGVVEVATGLALMSDPVLVISLLMSADVAGVGAALGRCFGIALLALGVACWRHDKSNSSIFRAMLNYNLLIALYLGYLGTVAHVAGLLLWPAVVLHAGVAAALLWTGRLQRSPTPQLRACLLACVLAAATPAMAQTAPPEPTAEPPNAEAGATAQALAKQAQNPIADLISVPFQNNTNFNFGPRERTQNILNFQPVIPFKLSEHWNLITRTVVPFIHQPSLAKGDSSDNGIGDVNPTLFFATSIAKNLLVGFGPTFTLPTSSQDSLGTRKWSAGPAGVVVWTPGKWVVGGLINNQWSFAGDSSERSVNAMLLQPFVNYNIADGWYLTTSPIITADWNAQESKDTWTVPIGGGVGRLFKIGKLPINTQVQVYDNVEKPEFGADWTLRLQVQFLFPK